MDVSNSRASPCAYLTPCTYDQALHGCVKVYVLRPACKDNNPTITIMMCPAQAWKAAAACRIAGIGSAQCFKSSHAPAHASAQCSPCQTFLAVPAHESDHSKTSPGPSCPQWCAQEQLHQSQKQPGHPLRLQHNKDAAAKQVSSQQGVSPWQAQVARSEQQHQCACVLFAAACSAHLAKSCCLAASTLACTLVGQPLLALLHLHAYRSQGYLAAFC